MNENELKGKVALVTGGARGIGKAIALELAGKGADVIITFFRSRDKAEETARVLRQSGVRCAALRINLRDRDSLVKLFEKVKEDFGKLDILVVNAAMGFFSSVADFPEEQWNITLQSNATAFFLCAREARKLMRDGGKIVAITSYGSKRYIPGYSAMGVSKASIETLTKYLAVEFAGANINVNCVSGGPVDTESLRMLPDYEKLVEETRRRTPAGRIATPEDIAKVVLFLCSDDSDWIRGQTIVADGGLSLL